jgi:hypothetical protein
LIAGNSDEKKKAVHESLDGLISEPCSGCQLLSVKMILYKTDLMLFSNHI